MSTETRKVLEMLAAGRITPDEAEKLLGRLSPGAQRSAPEGEATHAAGSASAERESSGLRYLRIVVDSPKRESVNVRVPIGLIRTGIKLSTLVPGRVGRRLAERGIDLSHLAKLSDQELIAELAALEVDISGSDGETIRVFCA